jgi:hypothetical protein
MRTDSTPSRSKPVKYCLQCGTAFTAKPSEMRRRKYCSAPCGFKAKSADVEQRFWARVKISGPDECWPFIGSRPTHHQVIKHQQKEILAHRYAYESAHGAIPDGLFVLHKCDNPPCVNPRHLFLGTQLDNMRDMDRKGRRGKGGFATPGGLPHNTRLNETQVREIRQMLQSGMGVAAVSRAYSMSETAIRDIRNGKNWAGVR